MIECFKCGKELHNTRLGEVRVKEVIGNVVVLTGSIVAECRACGVTTSRETAVVAEFKL